LKPSDLAETEGNKPVLQTRPSSRPTERRARRSVTAFALATLTLLITAATALAVTGQLTQLPGTAGCVGETSSGGQCADGKALGIPRFVALSPDGKNVYVASNASDAVAVFSRNTTTGELTQLAGTAGCVSNTGTGAACADGKALDGPESVAISPDGKNVYVTSTEFPGDDGNAVAVFQRDSLTGALSQLPGTAGCMSRHGSSGACTQIPRLDSPHSALVTPDGNHVYVATADAILAFARNTATGELTQLPGREGCVSPFGTCRRGRWVGGNSLAVSADGRSVYAAVFFAVAILRRNTTTGALFQPSGTGGCVSEDGSGTCVDGKALNGARSVAISPDDRHVYVASDISDAVAVFKRNATNGGLTQLVGPSGKAGCVSHTGSGGICRDGRALDGAFAVAVSPDGKNVYVASGGWHQERSDAVAAFARNPTNGLLSQLPGTAACVSTRTVSGCATGKALVGPDSVAVSPDGANVYSASYFVGAVTSFARETPP
jgi:DNA-binding beta-propeller fold protein YncE